MYRQLFKIIISVIIIFNLIFDAIAVQVNDNNGSAFITKAEFDSLKNNFQSQLDKYNQGIDSKIDEAIAAYLSGISVKISTNITSLIDAKTYPFLESFGNDNVWPIEYAGVNPTMTGTSFFCVVNNIFGTSTRTGAIAATWTPKSDRNYKRMRFKSDGTRKLNLEVVKGNIAGDYLWYTQLGTGISENSRYFQSGPQAIALPIDEHYNAAVTKAKGDEWVANLLKAKPTDGSVDLFCNWFTSGLNPSTINSWYNYQINFTSGKATGYQNFFETDVARPIDCSIVSFANNSPTDTSTVQLFNAGTTFDYLNNLTWTFDSSYDRTLGIFYNKDYSYYTVLWPSDVSRNNIICLVCSQVNKSDIPFNITQARNLFRQSASYVKGTDYTKRLWYPDDDNGTSDKTKDTWYYQRWANGTVYPTFYDFTYTTYVGRPSDKIKEFCYFDKEILISAPDATLESYLNNYPSTRGFPMWKIDDDGDFHVNLKFADTTKTYNVWFTKGPALTTDISSTKPTNCYTITGQNALGAVSVTGTTNIIKFKVEEGDYIYMNWTENGKAGGGRLALPIEAQIEMEK